MRFQLLFIAIMMMLFGCSTPQPETPNSKPETKSDSNDYYENGNIRIEKKRLENGDSLWIFKQEDGGCWEENFYRDGEIYKKIVYNSDCTKSAEYELKNGERHGEWTNYQANGKIWVSGNYKNGIPDGEMRFFDTTGKIEQIDYHFQKDEMEKNIFLCYNDLKSFKAKLTENKIKFIEDENIEVAGKTEYHFPILKWNDSELHFDLLKANEAVKCLSGKLTILEKNMLINFTIDAPIFQLMLQLRKGSYRFNNANIYIYDLKHRMTYRYEFENREMVRFHFETTNTFY